MESQLELLERMREKNDMAKQEMIGQRIERFCNLLGQQRDRQIVGIRGKFLREVRKLNRKHRGFSAATYKLHRSDIIAKYADPSSHLYAPEMRFGFKSKASDDEILDKTLLPEAYVDGKPFALPNSLQVKLINTTKGVLRNYSAQAKVQQWMIHRNGYQRTGDGTI